jgi:hypothetical protein
MAQVPAVQAVLEVAGTDVRRLTIVESTETTVLPDDSAVVIPALATRLLELSSAR